MEQIIKSFPEPSLLLNEEVGDINLLINMVKSKTYSSIDMEIPCSRFRGTMIKRSSNKIEIVGWQRNVARLQKSDVSLPTIIIIELDNSYVIKNIYLDNDFDGSKGLLCNRDYLNNNLRKELLNKSIGEDFFDLIQVNTVHCFHLSEVLAGILSSLKIVQEKELNYFFEEEIFDTYVRDDDFVMVGMQKISLDTSPVIYCIEFEGAMKAIKFNKSGRMYTENPLNAVFYVNGRKVFNKKLKGTTRRLYIKMKKLAEEGLSCIKERIVPYISNEFMCSNLYFKAFIGLVIQVLVMKKFYNNYNYVLHVLTGIQRSNTAPKCVGAVKSQQEANQYFPEYDLNKIF